MGIEIKITADTADEMRSEMRRLLGAEVIRAEPQVTHREPPIETQTFGPLPPASDEALQATAAAVDPDPPRRGRPRGSTKASLAAAAEAAAMPFLVRRYGGQVDSEHETPQRAGGRLCEMVAAAGSVEALDQLLVANEELSASFPADLTAQVTQIADNIRASLTAPAEDPAPPPVSIEPEVKPLLDLDKNPLTVITLNRRGAQNGVSALVQRIGIVKTVALLEKHGLTKVSDITDDADPKLVVLATEAATMLGLPTVAV